MYHDPIEYKLSEDFQISDQLAITKAYIKESGHAKDKLRASTGITNGIVVSLILWIPIIALVNWLY